jgi:alkylated DNA repair dioxygenase AlkB
MHSDDERDLVEGAPILSFSFGGVRTFLVQQKTETPTYVKEIKIPTHHATLIKMCGATQREFAHGIPKASKAEAGVGPRINVTVRCFRKKRRVARRSRE